MPESEKFDTIKELQLRSAALNDLVHTFVSETYADTKMSVARYRRMLQIFTDEELIRGWSDIFDELEPDGKVSESYEEDGSEKSVILTILPWKDVLLRRKFNADLLIQARLIFREPKGNSLSDVSYALGPTEYKRPDASSFEIYYRMIAKRKK